MNDQDTLVMLSNLRDRIISKVQRILYVLRGTVAAEKGAIEITFRDGYTVFLDAASDGETLAVKPFAWIDRFTEPLSLENRKFVEQSGKWTAFDVSGQPPYSHLIAEPVREVTPIRTPDNKVKGATIRSANGTINVEVEADEVFVDVI